VRGPGPKGGGQKDAHGGVLLRTGCHKEAHGREGPAPKEAVKRRRMGARCCTLASKRRRTGERARPKRRLPKGGARGRAAAHWPPKGGARV
jgi:hypothetical protein